MVAFRWVAGVLAMLLASGWLLSFTLFLVFDIPVWRQRARTLRRGTYMVLLLWFNVEVWRGVFAALTSG